VRECADKWIGMHRAVLHNNCKKLGRVPTTRRLCFDAQRCVHQGAGTAAMKFLERLRHLFLKYGSDLGYAGKTHAKAWHKRLQSSTFVFRFQPSPGDAQARVISTITYDICLRGLRRRCLGSKQSISGLHTSTATSDA